MEQDEDVYKRQRFRRSAHGTDWQMRITFPWGRSCIFLRNDVYLNIYPSLREVTESLGDKMCIRDRVKTGPEQNRTGAVMGRDWNVVAFRKSRNLAAFGQAAACLLYTSITMKI